MSTTTSQKAAPARPGQFKEGAAAARLFSNDSATGDDKASLVGHTTQTIHGKHVGFAPPLKPTKAVRVLFPLASRGAPNLPATDVGDDIRLMPTKTAPVTLLRDAHKNPYLSSATLEVREVSSMAKIAKLSVERTGTDKGVVPSLVMNNTHRNVSAHLRSGASSKLTETRSTPSTADVPKPLSSRMAEMTDHIP